MLSINDVTKAYGISQPINKGTVTKVAKTEGKKDSVALSTAAKDYQSIRNALKNVPDVRSDLVAELKAKYDAGEYRVNSRAIVDSLFNKQV